MSDTSGNTSWLNKRTQRVCRVAYTLNNTQPVSCTIIDDQPLFYMDFDYSCEEEDMFDMGEIGILESEISRLKEQIESYERAAPEFSHNTETRVEEILENGISITQPAETPKKENLLEQLYGVLSQSRVAEAYLAFAREYKVEIRFTSQVEKAFYDRRAGLILLNPDNDIADLTLLCARELRRHWQHRQGVLIHPLTFQPDQAVLVNRAQIADLTVSMIRCAWELQLSGAKEAWERIENSPMADLGRAFAREAYLDFRTINNGIASAAVFETWFLSERCQQEDKKLIQQMLADYQGYVFESEEAGQPVTPGLISGLGSVPYGKNYLAEHAHIIMGDPIFTDVRDRSNANFLWFIKFERSFKDAEQELQTESDLFAHGDPYGEPPMKEFDNGTEKSAEVITLFEEQPERKSGKSKHAKASESGAEIFYIRRFPGIDTSQN